MANNCVHYGNPTSAGDKLRLHIGSPDRGTYYVNNHLTNAPDCITCESPNYIAPRQCQRCWRWLDKYI